MELGRSGGVQGDRTDRTKTAQQIFARFGLTWHRKVNFSTFSGKLTFQSTRNGLQDTFIIYSSISHQHISQNYVQKKSIIGNLKISKVDPGKLVDSFSPRDGPVWALKGFWQDRSVRTNGAQLFGTRAWPIWSH